MFGQSWKIKKGTQFLVKKASMKLGLPENTANNIGKNAGRILGIIVAIKTADFIGAKAMVVDEVVENSFEDEVTDTLESEIIATENTAIAGSTVALSPSEATDHQSTTTFGYGNCATCGGDGMDYYHKECWYCDGNGNA